MVMPPAVDAGLFLGRRFFDAQFRHTRLQRLWSSPPGFHFINVVLPVQQVPR